MSDTRILAFNRPTFQQLQLKLPPPYDQWGDRPNNQNYGSEWTWQKMIEYARAIRSRLGTAAPFKFMAGWDEEVFILDKTKNAIFTHHYVEQIGPHDHTVVRRKNHE